MRPTHINIVGKSKRTFNVDVQPELRVNSRFSDIIQRFEAGGVIVLSKKIEKSDDIDPFINFLIRKGIPRSDIRVRFPDLAPEQLLRSRLSEGLQQSGLSFGADVAEHDPGLTRYFITTQSYQNIQSGRRHIIIGPKGSGKTAILRELSDNIGPHLVITPEHYATDILSAVAKDSLGNQMSAFVTTWKYTILVEIFRQLVANSVGDASGLAQIRRYLITHGSLTSDLSLFERFVSYLRRITRVRGKIGPAEAELGIDGSQELEKLFKLDELLALLPALRKVLRRTQFSVLVDELDQSWNNTETANQFLVSLLTAAIQLRGIDSNLHVIVFLRSEVFDLLKPTIAQLDKLRSDIEQIQWSPRELKNLIVSRAFDSLRVDPEKASAEAALSMLFPGVVPDSGVPVFDFMLSRTSYRPREVIQFCNLALSLAGRIGEAEITPEVVSRAEEEFSVWKLEYIVSENLYIYPRLDFLLDCFRGKPCHMSLYDMDQVLSGILLEAESDDRAPEWLRAGLEPPKLLETLYNLEVIGVEKPAILQGKRVRDWYDFVFSRPKARPEQSASFIFHPGLWRALELVWPT